MLTVDGFHTPLIPFVDTAGKMGALEPIQTDWNVPKLKVGVRIGFTVTVNTNGVTH